MDVSSEQLCRLYEKAASVHETRHCKLEACIDEYLAGDGIRGDGKGSLLRRARGKTVQLTDDPTNPAEAYRMVRWRTDQGGFEIKLGPRMRACAPPKPYDRTGEEIALDEVE